MYPRELDGPIGPKPPDPWGHYQVVPLLQTDSKEPQAEVKKEYKVLELMELDKRVEQVGQINQEAAAD